MSIINITNSTGLVSLIQNPDFNVLSIVVITLIAVAVIIIFVVRSVMPVTPFLYANARINARSNQRVSTRKIEELAECKNLGELENSLRDTSYINELEKLPKRDLRSFHKAIEKSFVNSILELKEISPKQAKPLFGAYLMFLEANLLKTIFRAKFHHNKIDEYLVFEVGNINPIVLKHLTEADSIADMNTVMSSTIYQPVFSKKYESTEEFDIVIEEFILNN
ncbi:MAG: V-type ATPase subunit, partial [Nitrosopumilus sp.]